MFKKLTTPDLLWECTSTGKENTNFRLLGKPIDGHLDPIGSHVEFVGSYIAQVALTPVALANKTLQILNVDQKFAKLLKSANKLPKLLELAERLPSRERKLEVIGIDSFHGALQAFVDKCIEELYFQGMFATMVA